MEDSYIGGLFIYGYPYIGDLVYGGSKTGCIEAALYRSTLIWGSLI